MCKTLLPKLEKSGDVVAAWNKKTNESACYHWDVDFKVGKKFLIGYAFHEKKLMKPAKESLCLMSML